MKMKLSDFVIDFVARQGVKHAFVVSGGASIHLLHSLGNHPDIDYICPHHEQSGAMAADAYARVNGELGCAIATSGPGATNLITGIAGAWFDSVPCLYLTGQVTTFRMKGDTGVRQFGFQETELLPMVEPITKYAVQLKDPLSVRLELEKAVYLAKTGRPGPVVIDIPDDLQREIIETDDLAGYSPDSEKETATSGAEDLQSIAQSVMAMVKEAERPVFVLGWGVRLSGAVDLARSVLEKLNIPFLTSWGARDIGAGLKNFAGTFGTHGTRFGNFTVQNADLVIAVGARLSTRETGTPITSWAREAKTVIVDIDAAELAKFGSFGKDLDLGVVSDAKPFLRALDAEVSNVGTTDVEAWKQQVKKWQEDYPVCPSSLHNACEINPYVLMEKLSEATPDELHIFSDTGCSIAWLMQGYHPKGGQRLYHDFNNTAMGWALPAAIGGTFALDGKDVLCISGDGSFMMNIQELATIAHHRLPVKIIVLNNKGYAMVRQTEDQWLDGVNAGTSEESGLGFPDFVDLAKSFGIPAFRLETADKTTECLGKLFEASGPILLDVQLPESHNVLPQSKFGYPIEDAEPLLPRSEFLANMMVKPMPKSLEPLEE